MDKEVLFAPRLAEEDLEIPGIGTVRVRGLSRAEAMKMQNCGSVEAQERLMISLGVVEPKLTEAEAGRWQKAAPAGELQPVSEAIGRLSGLVVDGDKEAYKSLRDGSESGI